MCAATPSHTAGDGTFWSRLLRAVRGGLMRALPARPLGPPRRRFRAVIFKVDRIGDFILALGAIRVALREWGEDQCLLVVSPLAEELAAREFPRTPRLVLPPFVGLKRLLPAVWAARKALGEIECEVALGLRHQRWDFDELCLAWLHASRVYVMEDVSRPAMYAHRRTYALARAGRPVFQEEAGAAAGGESCRELQMHRQLLSGVLGRPVTSGEVGPTLAPGPSLPAAEIVICPLGSHALRDLPLSALFAALGAGRAAGWSAVLVGSAAQSGRLHEIRATLELRGFPGVRVKADLSLAEFVQVLAAAPLVVTTESAAAHLATALDRPVVVIVGGGHFGQFGPWRRSVRQIWLTNPLECFGCNWSCVHPEAFCVTGVTPLQVTQAVTQLLSDRRKG